MISCSITPSRCSSRSWKPKQKRKRCKSWSSRWKSSTGFYEAVCKREKMAHTCMGNRVAMPHPCQVLTEDTFVSVAVLKAPIQWDEQHEVQAIFLVSVSRQKNKKLQDFYATTARLLLDEQRIGQLIQKRSYQTLAECLEAVDNERTE